MVVAKNDKALSVILFDLGFTLINFDGDFNLAMQESYLAMADALIQSGCPIDRASFARQYSEIISEYYRSRIVDLIERPVEENLLKTLASFGIESLPQNVLEEAIKAMYLYTEALWKIEPDTHQTLKTLKKHGYRLALISNASNSPDLNRLIDAHDLRKYFEIIVISADEGIRKPDPRIFQKTLSRMGADRANALMVGDTLAADILGARLAGIRSVWLTRRANRDENNEVMESIRPDYSASDLSSLVELVERLNSPAI